MSRIAELFDKKTGNILNVYFTAGFPRINSTLKIIRALEENGADIVELGMPYSDPLADGPVIQESSARALENGMTLAVLFEQLKTLRSVSRIPVVLMGYMNPVLQYGFEKFCADAASSGVDGIILPDLPPHEFETEYGKLIRKYGLDFIFLVTPETSPERIRKLDSLSTGFLYAVSSSSTTGSEKNMGDAVHYLEKLKSYGLKNPVLVGFGIRDREGFNAVCRHASGAIIGSAFIRALETGGNEEDSTRAFLRNIL